MDALHTVDIVIQPEGQPPHIRHYLYDFSTTLGSGITGPKPVWEGRDSLYGRNTALRNIAETTIANMNDFAAGRSGANEVRCPPSGGGK